MSDLEYLTAFIFCLRPGEQPDVKKYRKIANTEVAINKFLVFAKTKPDAAYVNFYLKVAGGKRGPFKFRKYL